MKLSEIAAVNNLRVSTKFGSRIHPVTGASQFHNGIDIPMPVLTPIRIPWEGEVVLLNEHPHGGKQMRIKHPNGYTTGYAHLESWCALVGKKISKGEVIAYSGNTGVSTGPHLHFTIRDTSTQKEFDPLTIFSP